MKPYEPEKLPITQLNYQQLLPLVGQANRSLARYDGLLASIPDPAVMLSPLTTQEAVLSSKIEGTQATVDEVLEHEAGLLKEGEKSKDIHEILNYRQALISGRAHLVDLPINLTMLRELHKILLNSVRGKDKTPGEFRTDQNWIGRPGSTMEQAIFVPPDPLQLPMHLQAWQEYLCGDDLDDLIQTAVVHAQFELLHPFRDGNGRIGRILIPLFLFQKKVLSEPMFYLSEYLENHREEYYDHLKGISARNDWDSWIKFFLSAVIKQSQKNIQTVENIKLLYDLLKVKVQEITHSQYSLHILDAIFHRPIFRVSELAKELNNGFNMHPATTAQLIKKLIDAGILTEKVPASGRRSAILIFPDLLNRAEGREVF